MIQLYQYDYCPYCAKVRNFMDKHKIKYEIIEIDRDNKPKEVTSTGGTVPVIKDDDLVMSKSDDIIEYLKKKFKIN